MMSGAAEIYDGRYDDVSLHTGPDFCPCPRVPIPCLVQLSMNYGEHGCSIRLPADCSSVAYAHSS